MDAGVNSSDEIVGKTDYDLAWTKEQAEAFVSDDWRVMINNWASRHIIEQQMQADGKLAWLDTNKIPLVDGDGNVVGILGTYEDITERIIAEDALRRARDELEIRVRERTAAEREQRALAEALRDTAALLNSTLNLDEVLDRILSEIGKVVPHEAANIVLMERQAARVSRYRTGPASDVVSDDMAGSPVQDYPNLQQMVHEKRPLIIPDTYQSHSWVERPHSRWVRSYLGAPIQSEGRVIGFINLNSAAVGFFTAVHAERLQAFANQAAIAIENARLYEQAQTLAAMEERQRLARDLHDAVSQTLWTANLIADVLPTIWAEDPVDGQASLEKLRRLTTGALAEMRALLLELRPAALTEGNLDDLLQQLANATMSHKKVDISLAISGDVCTLAPDKQVGIYRIAQEALNNIVKHARASRVSMNLACDGRVLTLKIEDDGRGFDLENVPPERLGMGIMRERAAAIGAHLAIESHAGSGTRIMVTLEQNYE
jgi:signal transduction histidine kinase